MTAEYDAHDLPDPELVDAVEEIFAPYVADLGTALGITDDTPGGEK